MNFQTGNSFLRNHFIRDNKEYRKLYGQSKLRHTLRSGAYGGMPAWLLAVRKSVSSLSVA